MSTDTKFTPGRWENIGRRDATFPIRVVNPAGDAELGNWLIAECRWQTDATLISAAPDLYEALYAAANYLVVPATRSDEAAELFNRATAALAKARGEV